MDYEDADVWEKAMRVAEQVCRLAMQLRRERASMRSQLTRAAISVPSNIAEGWRRESAREKAHFFAIAHGSLAELQTQVALCRRLAWVGSREAASIEVVAADVSCMLTSLRKRWRNIGNQPRGAPARSRDDDSRLPADD